MKEAKLKVVTTKENVIENKVLCSWWVDYPRYYIVLTIIIFTCYVQLKCLKQKVHNEKEKVVPSILSLFPIDEYDALLTQIRSKFNLMIVSFFNR